MPSSSSRNVLEALQYILLQKTRLDRNSLVPKEHRWSRETWEAEHLSVCLRASGVVHRISLSARVRSTREQRLNSCPVRNGSEGARLGVCSRRTGAGLRNSSEAAALSLSTRRMHAPPDHQASGIKSIWLQRRRRSNRASCAGDFARIPFWSGLWYTIPENASSPRRIHEEPQRDYTSAGRGGARKEWNVLARARSVYSL